MKDERTERIRNYLKDEQSWDQVDSDLSYLIKLNDMLMAHIERSLPSTMHAVLVHNETAPELPTVAIVPNVPHRNWWRE